MDDYENTYTSYKNLFQTISKDYNIPLYSFHELESYMRLNTRGFKKSLDEYKNEIYKKNFTILENNTFNSIFLLQKPDNYIRGHIENVLRKPTYCVTLENQIDEVKGVEHLLSAMEALSIDNASIDLCGSNELPVLDGSSLVWINELVKAGTEINHETTNFLTNFVKKKRKFKFHCNKFFSVCRNDSFILYYPSNSSKITIGLDYSTTAPLIGKQWFSYDIYNDNHYRWEISPSRMYIPTVQDFYESSEKEYFKAGINNCVNLCAFDKWIDDENIRFYDTECARHEVLDLIGCLGLLSNKGNGGVPLGHIVAYKPSLELYISFVKLLKEMIVI